MFAALFARLVGTSNEIHQRPEGVAFFKTAKDLYGLVAIEYLALNIPVPARKGRCMHCWYSDAQVQHGLSGATIDSAALVQAGLNLQTLDTGGAGEDGTMQFPLRQRAGETAVFAVKADPKSATWEQHKASGMRDIRLLGNYFHSHILRINGNDAENDMLVTARELDCLKWTAAGKTAWEASVILGISERTVRFHLNAAREKLQCATTTQAVAKAVGYQLIDI